MSQIVVTECPQCGAPVSAQGTVCSYCRAEYMVRSTRSLGGLEQSDVQKYITAYKNNVGTHGDSPALHYSLGLCYLELGLYPFANKAFADAIALLPDTGEPYYYAAIAKFAGKRPFLASLSVIKEATEYLGIANMLGNEGKYYYLLGLIQEDFYEKKRLQSGESSAALYQQAQQQGVLAEEMQEVRALLGV